MRRFAFAGMLTAGCGAMIVWVAVGASADSKAPIPSPESVRAQILADASVDQVQRDIVSDGVVTTDEVRSAFANLAGCVSARTGIELKLDLDANGQLLGYGAELPKGIDVAAYTESKTDCAASHFDAVDSYLAAVRAPSAAELAEFNEKLSACLKDNGASGNASIEAACADEISSGG